MNDWQEDNEPCLAEQRWPMTPNDLLPRERWLWWEQLWTEVVALAERYQINPGKDWWEDGAKVEAMAALAAWVARYDSGEWDDPPGKLALLYDIERVRQLIRGQEPFHPGRDRGAFARFLVDAGCQPPPSGSRTQANKAEDRSRT
jgi:hypothetical protein